MTATNQFAAHVGLDWADKKHDVCVQFKNGERVFHLGSCLQMGKDHLPLLEEQNRVR